MSSGESTADGKGHRIEPGVWRRKGAAGYVAEVSFADQQTGRRVREQKSFRRLDLARAWRQTRKTDALRGEITRRRDLPKPMVFSRFAEEYLDQWSRVKKRPSTCTRDATSIRRLNVTFGKRYLSEITRRDIERYLADRQGEGVSPATTNRELSCLKNMLRKAVDWQYLEASPAAGVRQQREELKPCEFLAEPEIAALIEAAAPHLRTLLTLAVNTGMRRGELFRLEWRDVAFDRGDRGMITVRETKNGDCRHIPMNAAVRQALDVHPRRIVGDRICPLVFAHEDGAPIYWLEHGYHGALKRAGITRHVRFHDLRHTFASHLVMRGVDIRTVAQLLGHRDIKVTMRYAHLAPQHLQAAVDTLATHVDSARTQETGQAGAPARSQAS